jgi:hypothetical protein
MKQLLLMGDFLNWNPEDIESYTYVETAIEDSKANWLQLQDSICKPAAKKALSGTQVSPIPKY